LNVSHISNLDLDYTSGIYTGAFGHIRFSDIYAMPLELMYSGQGGKANIIGEWSWNGDSPTRFDIAIFRDIGYEFKFGLMLEA